MPRARSGDVYAGVPRTAPSTVIVNSPASLLAAHFVNGDNVRVPHLSGGTGFTEEFLCVVPASLKLYSNTLGIRRSPKPVWGVELPMS